MFFFIGVLNISDKFRSRSQIIHIEAGNYWPNDTHELVLLHVYCTCHFKVDVHPLVFVTGTDFICSFFGQALPQCSTIFSTAVRSLLAVVSLNVFYSVCCAAWFFLLPQTGVPDVNRHPGHPTAAAEADHSRTAGLQHRHLQPASSGGLGCFTAFL